MKNLVKFLFPLLVLGLVAACKSEPKGQKVDAKEATGKAAQASAAAKTYVVDAAKSSITWTGSKPTGTHQGTLSISNGSMSVKGGNIEAGRFGLDMNSITVTDLKPEEGKEKLEGHLKTGDFFEVEKFPSGQFVITKVEGASGDANITHNITGDLTLKGQTKSVTIPANVAMVGNQLTAVTPSFKINRTEWGIQYASGIIGTVKENLINDDIALVLNIIAAAK